MKSPAICPQDFEYVGCTCGALKEEMQYRQAMKDAARYRWLREYGFNVYNEVFQDDLIFVSVEAGAAKLDEAVDLAIAKSPLTESARTE